MSAFDLKNIIKSARDVTEMSEIFNELYLKRNQRLMENNNFHNKIINFLNSASEKDQSILNNILARAEKTQPKERLQLALLQSEDGLLFYSSLLSIDEARVYFKVLSFSKKEFSSFKTILEKGLNPEISLVKIMLWGSFYELKQKYLSSAEDKIFMDDIKKTIESFKSFAIGQNYIKKIKKKK